MTEKLESMVCPEGHVLPFERWNYARDFSGGDKDAMTGAPMYESGLWCHTCDRAYGLGKLREYDYPLTKLNSY